MNWRWPHFRLIELADRESGELIVVPVFLDWLEGVRHVYGKPMIINDGTRTPERQFKHSGRRTGSHVDGMAVDVRIHGADAYVLDKIVMNQGVLGKDIGQSHDLPIEKRFLHLDMWVKVKAPAGCGQGFGAIEDTDWQHHDCKLSRSRMALVATGAASGVAGSSLMSIGGHGSGPAAFWRHILHTKFKLSLLSKVFVMLTTNRHQKLISTSKHKNGTIQSIS